MDIRPLKPKDYQAAQELIRSKASWMAMPPMESLFGKFSDGKLVGVIGIQRPVVVECLVAENGRDARDLTLWLDGVLTGSPYFFFIREPAFQATVEEHYKDNIEGWEGKVYVRRRI